MPNFPQLERLFWLHAQAKNNRRPNAARLAAHFEISTKTAQRDINHLRDRFHAPLEYDPARKGYYYTDDLYELPCLPASQQEVLCLLAARRLLEKSAGGYISRELECLGEKIFAGAHPSMLSGACADQAFSAVWSGYSPAQEEIFRRAAWALLRHRLICFDYRSPQTDASTHRQAEPHHLLHYNASWVLIAWCRQRQAFRNFYLARMTVLTTSDETFEPRPESAWRPLLQSAFGLFFGDETVAVTLRFSPFRARWIREQHWHPAQTLKELANGGLELTLPAADFREIKMKILQFGADCEVIAPLALREEIENEIAKMAGLYKGNTTNSKVDEPGSAATVLRD
ncbi:MAG: WYL domain-containing protein [Desulfobacteraceae bacterium]|nr:WYL domain-containing protein [Desulfobacteraceae bacterium]